MLFVNLKKFRESTGMTQREFSKQLEMSYQTYNGYEVGIREPKSDFWVLVSAKYGVSIDYLMGRTDDPAPIGTKKSPTSDETEAEDVATNLYERILRLSPENRAKLSELADLYLGSQYNK